MAQNALPVKTANIRQQYASTCSKKLPGLEYFSRMQGHDVSLPAQAGTEEKHWTAAFAGMTIKPPSAGFGFASAGLSTARGRQVASFG